MPKRKTQKAVIEDFNQVHGNCYDYSLVEYVNSSTKVKVICPFHGLFEITPGHHKNGVGCRKCYFVSQKISKEEFIRRSGKYFGNRYDYSRFSDLPADGEQVSIFCKEHNVVFLQEPKNHMRGHTGCPLCISLMLSGHRDFRGEIKSKDYLNSSFVQRAREVHGDKYNYDQFEYINSSTKGRILCSKHGEFWQSPNNHLKGHNCPACAKEDKYKTSFKNLCEELGIDYWRSLKRREAGLSKEKIFEKEYVRNFREVGEITVFGIKYPNLKAAVRCLETPASRETIARWLEAGLPPDEAFTRVPNPGYSQGIIYLITHIESGKQYVGLTIQTLERRWKYHVEQARSGYIKNDESLHNAIRQYGADAFVIRQIDQGTSKEDLEKKERQWIRELGTLTPNGYNISSGGVSGGSNKKSFCIDSITFESVEKAAIYLSETRNISIIAARKRISLGRIDIKTPAKKGESLVKTKAYKTWSRIVHGALNPKSKEYIPGLDIYEPWRDFKQFLHDVGNPPRENMAFSRLDKDKGFFPENCAWMTKSEASIINAKHMKSNGKLGRINDQQS